MKPFLVICVKLLASVFLASVFLALMFTLVLFLCGYGPASTPSAQETPPAAPAESDAAAHEAAVDATKDPEPAPHPPNASPTSQADAVAAIKKLGGTVNLDKTSGKVVGVNLCRTQVTDAMLVHLKALTTLTELNLTDTQITDAGLEHLKGLTSLTELRLSGPQITDAGLEQIKAALPKCSIRRLRPIPAAKKRSTPSAQETLPISEPVDAGTERVTADWSQSGFDTAGTSFNPHEKRISATNASSLELLWRNQHSSSIRGFVSIVGQAAYYGDYGGEFRAVEAATGETIWSKRLQGKHQGHAVVDDLAYVTSISRLYAFDTVSGRTVWTKDPPTGQFGGPLVADGVLYAGTSSPPTLHALHAATGDTMWSVPGGSIAVSDGVLYMSSAETLQALDARTGETMWKVSIAEGQLTGPVVSDGVIYVHSSVGKLYAFDATDRESEHRSPLWVGKTSIQDKGDGTHTPAVGDGKVFLGANSTFYAFDTAAEKKSERIPVWTATVKAPFFASSPSVANGVVYSTAGNHDIYAFDTATGEVLWNHHATGTEYPMRSKPTIANGRLYHAATFGFTLYVFHIPKETSPPAAPETLPTSQADAVAAIKKLRGRVTLDKTSGEVVGVSLARTQVTDAGLVHLQGMTSLTGLSLVGTQITDAGLEQLKGRTSLTSLDLRGTQITDAGLVHLKGLTRLETLFLTHTQITDAGLAEIKAALPKCYIGGLGHRIYLR
jgi:outer membrane protein assembly factor BamB/uncharacterized protein YjbI with pentapeptide repeats